MNLNMSSLMNLLRLSWNSNIHSRSSQYWMMTSAIWFSVSSTSELSIESAITSDNIEQTVLKVIKKNIEIRKYECRGSLETMRLSWENNEINFSQVNFNLCSYIVIIGFQLRKLNWICMGWVMLKDRMTRLWNNFT